ncbi:MULTISPECIES: VOC family protein [unclassified Sphingobium]|nr:MULTISPECIES: VOC family protein [unclassified Sphingobium]MBG6120009.1 catechol 2,3-dioxygenase-like lactoylglutathione lyase family enzyme [Sphingobium sp. JAI105]TWD05790.1 catechol 2,3-dioxygenase-like lactoylglutathione lyase family enzyme [Sphingobium sp. AEW010]TWD23343.1 catechol 2,3-dioxygenase-like lactoylglutathione lyase family enzyme [Sphingobium sp. AEW013]TWD25203.1 catechol 2,3-dioxygenase-like lactoylglutathione lyase family enzyme [Sphingobium sp. AEW001]
MAVVGLEHVNLRVPDPSASLAFFRDILQMQVVPPPGRTSTEQSGWVLDRNRVAVIHVAGTFARYEPGETLPAPTMTGSGAIHHIALTCEDYAQVRDRLAQAGLEFREAEVPQISLRQIFVAQVDGVLFELNFREAR